MFHKEASHSGLVHHVGNVAWGNPPRVRISPLPPLILIREIRTGEGSGEENPLPCRKVGKTVARP